MRRSSRRETVAVAEGAAGGFISAALLSVAGASAYFVGGAVIYTVSARKALLDISDADMAGLRPATETYALLLARRMRDIYRATWRLAETGATGPAGNRYGDPASHACFAVVGPAEREITLRTGSDLRSANMQTFANAALRLLGDAIDETRAP